MGKNTHQWRRQFYAAFIGLSAVTIALLAASILFFRSPSTQVYLQAWVEDLLAAPGGNSDGADSALTYHNSMMLENGFGRHYVAEVTATIEPVSTPTQAQSQFDPARIGDLLIEDPTPEDVEREARERKPNGPQGELIIPSMNIAQQPQWVYVKDGQWDISTLHNQVGWLQTTGTYPEDDLAMVFIGHVTLPYPGGAGPFLYLDHRKIGDEIHYRSGAWLYVYQIEKRTAVPPDAIEEVYIQEKNKLALVTCTSWNAVTRSYDRRLLLEAKLIRIERAGQNNDNKPMPMNE
jgi:LPXTG-site transpeptidase (sortase) family protein